MDEATDSEVSDADNDFARVSSRRRRSLSTSGRRTSDYAERNVSSGDAGQSSSSTPGQGVPDGRHATVREADDTGQSPRVTAEEPGTGLVSLVGSGPGHPDLLTRRAWNRLTRSDVVFHDSLTDDRVIDQLPDSVEVVDVGKRPPDRTSQDDIHGLLRERARRGEDVVRLKGGDPTVFGRGGEEAVYLASEGIPFELVPGVSSVLAVPSVSGIPLTHREHASSVTVITGHETPNKDESALNWDALADTVVAGGTLVILMGVQRLPENVRTLRAQGVPAETPVAMVQEATCPGELTVEGTLENIVDRCRSAEVESPATAIVGDVVGVRGTVEDQLCRPSRQE